MEIPDNANPEYIMDFEKFTKSRKGLMFSDEKVFIEGTFKGKRTGKIISGDNFWANKVHTSGESINAEEIYKTYLAWFNYTLRKGELERIFISAKFKEDAVQEESA